MRKILHLNAGNETGGGMHHIVNLLDAFNRYEFSLGVFEQGELLKRAKRAGIKTVYFPSKTRLSVPLLYQIKKYIDVEGIDVVHTHGPRTNVYINVLKKFADFHWVTTVHSDPVHDFMNKGPVGNLFSRLHINAIKNADQVIAISHRFKENLIELGVKKDKISTVLNGIDFKKKHSGKVSREDFGIKQDAFLFLQVARCEPVKGIELALEAFERVAKKRRDCYLMIVGDGSVLPDLKKQASERGISDRVHFPGFQEDASAFYKLADVTLLTSFSESFPLVLLESARAKIPVISTDVGAVNELVKNESLGWKVEAGDVDGLREAMTEAVDKRRTKSLKPMGEHLFAHASAEFSLEIFAENIYNIYADVKKESTEQLFGKENANNDL